MQDNLSHRDKVFAIRGPGTGPYEASVDGSFLVCARDHRGGERAASTFYLVQRPGPVPANINMLTKRLTRAVSEKKQSFSCIAH